jgi:hypothetical protein
MALEMSLCVVQPPRKSAFESIDSPGATINGAEVEPNLPVCILVPIEVPLSRFSNPTVAFVWLGVSVDVAAV